MLVYAQPLNGRSNCLALQFFLQLLCFKSTVMRKVSKESNTGFRFCCKINTTYQGLLRATSILTLWQKLSPPAPCVVLGLKSVIWRLGTCQGMMCSYYIQARLWACGCGDVSTPSFGSHLNPISTRGADYAHSILVSTPSFESHRRAWYTIILVTIYLCTVEIQNCDISA